MSVRLTFRLNTPPYNATSSLTGMTGQNRGQTGPTQTYRIYNDFDGLGASTARMVKLWVFYQQDVGGLYRSSGVEAADQQWMEARLTGTVYDLDGTPSSDKTIETTTWKRFGARTPFELPGAIPAEYGRQLELRINPTGSGGSIDFNDIRIGMSWDRGTDFLEPEADGREGRGIVMPGGQEHYLLAGHALKGIDVALSPFRQYVFFVKSNTAAIVGDAMTVTTTAAATNFAYDPAGPPPATDFTIGADNTLAQLMVTATNLAAVINTAAIGVYAQAKTIAGRACVRLLMTTARVTSIASANAAFIEAGNISANLLHNEITNLDPEEDINAILRQESYPPFNDVDVNGSALAAGQSYVVDAYKTPYLPTYRIWMYNSVGFGAGVAINVRVNSTTSTFTGGVDFAIGASEAATATNLAAAINAAAIGVSAAAVSASEEDYVEITGGAATHVEMTSGDERAFKTTVQDYVYVRGAKGAPGEPPASPGSDYAHVARTAKSYGASLSAPEMKVIHQHATINALGTSAVADLGAYLAVIGGLVMKDPAEQDGTASSGASKRQYVKLTNGGAIVINQQAPGAGELFLGIVETNGANQIDFAQDRAWLIGRGARVSRSRLVKESWHPDTEMSLDNEVFLFGYFSRYSGAGALNRTITVAAGHRISARCTVLPADQEGIIVMTGTELVGDGTEIASAAERHLVTLQDQWIHGKKVFMGTGANSANVVISSAFALAGSTFEAYASDLFVNHYRPFVVRSLKLRVVPMGAFSTITAELFRVPTSGALETIYSVTKTGFPAAAAYVEHAIPLTKRPSGGSRTDVPMYLTADEAVVNPWKGEGIFLKLSALAGIARVNAEMEIDERVN